MGRMIFTSESPADAYRVATAHGTDNVQRVTFWDGRTVYRVWGE